MQSPARPIPGARQSSPRGAALTNMAGSPGDSFQSSGQLVRLPTKLPPDTGMSVIQLWVDQQLSLGEQEPRTRRRSGSVGVVDRVVPMGSDRAYAVKTLATAERSHKIAQARLATLERLSPGSDKHRAMQKYQPPSAHQLKVLAFQGDWLVRQYVDSPYVSPSIGYKRRGEQFALVYSWYSGTLREYATQQERPSTENIWKALVDGVRGIVAMHAANLAHRDWKPSNIGVNYGRGKPPVAFLRDFDETVYTSYTGVYRPTSQYTPNGKNGAPMRSPRRTDLFAIGETIRLFFCRELHRQEPSDRLQVVIDQLQDFKEPMKADSRLVDELVAIGEERAWFARSTPVDGDGDCIIG